MTKNLKSKEFERVDKFKVEGLFVGKRKEYAKKYCHYGSKFKLVREPDNEYDKNAILVKLPVRGGKHQLEIGYMPKAMAAEIAPLIDQGQDFRATFRVKIINEKTFDLIHMYLNLEKRVLNGQGSE